MFVSVIIEDFYNHWFIWITAFSVDTVWCNQIGIVFAEMSSWTALTWYTAMKTASHCIMYIPDITLTLHELELLERTIGEKTFAFFTFLQKA